MAIVLSQVSTTVVHPLTAIAVTTHLHLLFRFEVLDYTTAS